jgi:predicted acyltransferase
LWLVPEQVHREELSCREKRLFAILQDWHDPSASTPSALNAFLAAFVSRDLSRRDAAVDTLRGLAILGMILVNHPPPGATPYGPLVHAVWHGWTFADTIFPAFLFVVGVSISMALPVGRNEASSIPANHYWKIVRRVGLLLLLNYLLENFPYYELHKAVLTGTLASIAWCYLIVSVIALNTRWRAQMLIVGGALALQWLLLSWVNVPGAGQGVMTPEGNATYYLDRLLLGGLLPQRDGHAIFSFPTTLAACGTTMIGVLAGTWLKAPRSQAEKIAGMFAVGLGAYLLGSVWNLVLPINKELWTASYVALNAGISLQFLAVIYWLTSVCGFKAWALPLQIAGVNALAFYLIAQWLQRLLFFGRLHDESGTRVRLGQYIWDHWFNPWTSGQFGALVFSLTFLLVCYSLVWLLYRNRMFFKL